MIDFMPFSIFQATIMNPKKLVIASRESLLAMWQAKHIQGRLKALYPDCEVEILGMTTRGDQILDRTLSKVGGKGLFVKELEQALYDGRADLAVHSIKDVPMDLPEGFALAAIGERANPFDAFVSNQYARLEEMPKGAIVAHPVCAAKPSCARAIRIWSSNLCAAMCKPVCPNLIMANTTRLSWPPPVCSVWNWTNASA